MARNPETKQYITWADVQQAWRWFEWGYGVKIVVVTACKSPPGEQFDKMYLSCSLRDADGQEVVIHGLPSVQFPSAGYTTLAGAYMALLYKLDAKLATRIIWAEPSIGRKPARAGAVG